MSLDYKDAETEESPTAPEEVLAQKKKSIRKISWWAAAIGGFLVVIHLGWLIVFGLLGISADFSILFKSIFFILGLVSLVGGLWGLYYAKTISIPDIVPTAEAIRYLEQSKEITPFYTYILVVSIIAVFLSQVAVGIPFAVAKAGLVKPLVWEGEFWRLLTVGTLHGGFLHIYFNGQALYGLGTTVEYLANRAHLAIVFVAAIIIGALFSLYFLPDAPSVGASGGIMGIIGYAAILGYRRKQQMPPEFLKSILINIGFIAAFGIVAYEFIDNFAHFGGLLTGVVYGFLQIPLSPEKDPRRAGKMADFGGMLAMGIFVFTSILSILLILQIIKF